MSFILAIDQGTTSTRSIIFDENLKIIGAAQEEFTQHFPQSGWVEHNPKDLLSTSIDTCRSVLNQKSIDPKKIAALFVEMSAESPEVAQMIFQEAKTESWRLDYLVTQHTRPLLNKIEKALGRRISPNQYYFLVGAGSAPFTARYECMALFGTDPQDKAFIDAHKATLTGLVEGENS